jgi:hypothetical protein
MAENVTGTTTNAPAADGVSIGDSITTTTYSQMLNILEELTSHTHIFYDDYTTACNCNCDCNCTRGIL